MAYSDHVPFFGLEIELNAVLELFCRRRFDVRQDQTAAHEVSHVADIFACREPVEIRLVHFELDATDGVNAKPCRYGEAVLVWPVADWWQ